MMVRLSTLQIEVGVLIVDKLRELRDRRRKKIADFAGEDNGCDEGDER
jgi:hypothetical protein